MVILYIIIIIIILFIILSLYIKLKYKFWSIQPVFHIYDLKYWIKPFRIIDKNLPKYNKYINIINIQTNNIANINDTDKQLIVNFIKNYYLRNNTVNYLPTQDHIFNYLIANNHESYISIYTKQKQLIKNNDINNIKYNTEYIGLLTSRVLYIKLNNKITFPTYYVDNLCVHKEHRKLGIAPQLIQTHYYNIRRYNSKINTCLFKREGVLNAIIPLTTYTTYGYNIENIMINIKKFDNNYQHIRITEKTLYLLKYFFNIQFNNFSCVIIPDYSNLIHLINSNNILIYALIYNENLISVYIYRNPCLSYYSNNCIELISSIHTNNIDNSIYINGFILSLNSINKFMKFKTILIENISSNNIVINYLKKNNILYYINCPSAFFLYNYACYSFEPSKCFLIY